MASHSGDPSRLPKLSDGNYQVTSRKTRSYNCIAWAAGDDSRWWEPDPKGAFYWPPEAPRARTLSSYIAAFASLGYEKCRDGCLVVGVEKVALYAQELPMNVFLPTHAARLTPSGKWASKLGTLEDIEHDSERDVEGPEYGKVVAYLCRPRKKG